MILLIKKFGERNFLEINLDRNPFPTVMLGGAAAVVRIGQFFIKDEMKLFLKDFSDKVVREIDLNYSPTATATVTATGMGGARIGLFYVTDAENENMIKETEKPKFYIPSMQEIRELPWNGYSVVSTSSGCGGSCTGYRMAGFKVLWANEFAPIAQESYFANKADDSYLDCRDIKEVMPNEILERIGKQQGEIDVFDGSPPCQAFSTAGTREKNWGDEREYDHGVTQKNEELFFEYARILKGLMPKVFIAENVSGLVKGKAKGYFLEILQALKDCGYNVKARLLDAQWLGVPQQRQRIIFIGVRNDIGLSPEFPDPLPYRYSLGEALQNSKIELINDPHGRFSKQAKQAKQASFSITTSNYSHSKADEGNGQRNITIEELKIICAFPYDFILKGTYRQQWGRLGNSVPPVMMYHIAKTVKEKILDKIGGT